jgi:hypothetical protein
MHAPVVRAAESRVRSRRRPRVLVSEVPELAPLPACTETKIHRADYAVDFRTAARRLNGSPNVRRWTIWEIFVRFAFWDSCD